jgi:hypothetical protein
MSVQCARRLTNGRSARTLYIEIEPDRMGGGGRVRCDDGTPEALAASSRAEAAWLRIWADPARMGATGRGTEWRGRRRPAAGAVVRLLHLQYAQAIATRND